MKNTELTAVDSNRSYWQTISENIKNGWEKVKSNTFVNMFFPLEDLSNGHTEALLMYAVPGGGAARTIVRGGKQLFNRLSRQTVKKLTPTEIENFLSQEKAIEQQLKDFRYDDGPVHLAQNVEVKTIKPKDIILTKEEEAFYNGKRKEEADFQHSIESVPPITRIVMSQDPQYLDFFMDPDISNASRAMYDQYRNAMHRHRTYTWSGFPAKFERGWDGILYKRSALLGSDTNGYFHVSHFAPKNLREGYELIKQVAGSTQPTVFTVTDDLAKQLEKAGFKQLAEIPQIFNGEVVNKKVMINAATKKEDVLKHLQAMAQWYPEYNEYVKLVENIEWPRWSQSEFGPYPIPEEYNKPASQKLGDVLISNKIKNDK